MKKNNKYLVLVILSILVSISGLSVSVLAYSASYNTLKYMELAKKNAKKIQKPNITGKEHVKNHFVNKIKNNSK